MASRVKAVGAGQPRDGQVALALHVASRQTRHAPTMARDSGAGLRQAPRDGRRVRGHRRSPRIAAGKNSDERARRGEVVSARRVSEPTREQFWIGGGQDRTPQRLLEQCTRLDDPRGIGSREQRSTIGAQRLTGPPGSHQAADLKPIRLDRAPTHMRTRCTCALIVAALPRSPYSASASCSVVIPSGCMASTASSSSERSARSRRPDPS